MALLESIRQRTAGDSKYTEENRYTFEFIFPTALNNAGNESLFYPLAKPPQSLSITHNHSNAIADGLGYTYERRHATPGGTVDRTLRMNGHFGVQPKAFPALVSNFNAIQNEYSSISLTRPIFPEGNAKDQRLSGYRHEQNFSDLLQLYQDIASIPQYMEECKLIFHMHKEDFSWEIAPGPFTTSYASQNPTLSRYDFTADIIRAAEPLAADLVSPDGWLTRFKNTVRAVRSAVLTIQEGIALATAYVAEISRFIENVGNIVSTVTNIANTAAAFISTAKRIINLPKQIVKNAIASLKAAMNTLNTALGLSGDTFSPEAVQGLRQMENGLEALSIQPIYASEQTTGVVVDGFTVSATTEVPLRSTDTITGLARRYLGSGDAWRVLAELNNLRSPFFSDTRRPGVLAYGDNILVPVQSTATPDNEVTFTAPTISNAVKVYGSDIKINTNGSGEWVTNDSKTDVAAVYGLENAQQALWTRVSRVYGEDPVYSSVGMRSLVGDPALSEDEARLRLRQALEIDPRVVRVSSIDLEIDKGTMIADVSVALVNDSVVNTTLETSL